MWSLINLKNCSSGITTSIQLDKDFLCWKKVFRGLSSNTVTVREPAMIKPAMNHGVINVLMELMARTDVITRLSVTTTNLTDIPVLSIICNKWGLCLLWTHTKVKFSGSNVILYMVAKMTWKYSGIFNEHISNSYEWWCKQGIQRKPLEKIPKNQIWHPTLKRELVGLYAVLAKKASNFWTVWCQYTTMKSKKLLNLLNG